MIDPFSRLSLSSTEFCKLSNEDQNNFTGCVYLKRNKYNWYKNGVLHRRNGPALVYLDYKNCKPVIASYWYDGLPHRSDGPSRIHYSVNKLFRRYRYAYKGQDLSLTIKNRKEFRSWLKVRAFE